MPHVRRLSKRDLSPGNWVLFAFTAQHAALSWLVALLAMALFLAHKPRFEGAAILGLQWRAWFAKRYKYSTTFIRTIFWGPGFREIDETHESELDERHERHERVHTRQFEDAAVRGFFLGMVLASCLWSFGWYAELWQPLLVWELVWLLTPLLVVLNWVTALLRWGLAPKERPAGGKERNVWQRIFEVAYRDSEHERSAYAQTDLWPNGRSWTELRDERR